MKKIVLVVMALVSGFFAGAQQKQMNVLFIAVDDLKPILSVYGDPMVKTPNVEKLAERGTVFMKNYCQQAVCGATGPSLMTGLRPDQTKIWGNRDIFREVMPDVVTLPQYFRQNGYWTCSVGKIYHQSSMDEYQDSLSWTKYVKINSKNYPQPWGPPVGGGYQNPVVKAAFNAYKPDPEAVKKAKEAEEANLPAAGKLLAATRKLNPPYDCADVPDESYHDGQVAIEGVKLIEEAAKKGQPFFVAIGFSKPHLAFCAPKKYWDLYDRNDIKLAEFQQKAANSTDWAYHGSSDIQKYKSPDFKHQMGDDGLLKISEESQRTLKHGYYACISYVDAQLGKVLQALKDNNLEDNTIIIFWGDHGWQLGEHSLWGKSTNFEDATRSPMIIVDPRSNKAIKSEQLTEFLDIYPTICDLAGVKVPDYLMGESLRPIIYGKDQPVKERAISQYPKGPGMAYTMRTNDGLRYTVYMAKGAQLKEKFNPEDVLAEELYDYNTDPLETVSLQNDPKYKSKLKGMRKMFIQFFNEERLNKS